MRGGGGRERERERRERERERKISPGGPHLLQIAPPDSACVCALCSRQQRDRQTHIPMAWLHASGWKEGRRKKWISNPSY